MAVTLKTLVSALLCGSLLGAKAFAGLPEEERTVIALFGDSISAGYNANLTGQPDVGGATDHPGCSSVYLTGILRNEPTRPDNSNCPTNSLNSPIYDGNRESRNAIVANWGFGGSGSDLGVSRMASELAQTKAELDGSQYIVLIIYGTNDQNRGISSVTTKANIESMIAIAKSAPLGYEPIVGLLTPRDDRTGNGPSSINALNNLIQMGAQAQGAQVVDHYSKFVNYPGSFLAVMDQEDFALPGSSTPNLIYLHPNDQGYLLIAETWFEQALKARIPALPNDIILSPVISLLLGD